MSHLSNKAKHYGLIALKVLILAATFWFIYNRLHSTDERTINSFFDHLTKTNPIYLLLFILLAAANWSLEIKKWQLLVNTLQRLSFRESMRQCLASLSVSMSTPNRIGEYGAKALFFSQEKRKKVMVLNLVSNTSQMLITIFFGIPGLLYFLFRNDIAVSLWKLFLIFILVILLIVGGYYLRKTKLLIKGLTLEKVFNYVQTLPLAVRWKVVLFSALRYIIFSGLFYVLLRFFGVSVSLPVAAPLITAMYLIASVLPTFFFLDVAIKGGAAIWIFSYAGIPEIPILSTVTAMWLLNFVLPAIWGSFYVVKFKINS